ncbi:MAG: bifunctional phosphopantothenoylcysteine decarboxylase/phosphopantothenate--cysteine ligase CoaBC [Chloroflexi bacterium]|nr:bifunctional phosphopantothenoylcysteine decarboxylase/phosphopantothenate--cysteine ligase CoaBC [Chloroflexota bacterium]MYD66099.1 bifunctional phosphopantothenoylcysteine decarboxylase/phosphopantothenate--cysteine ligase CoaBC [Chloroflexota bacterium]
MSEATGPLAGRTIVLGVTGSIAAYKAVEVASRLVQAGATVRTVMTRAATEFVGPATFRGVTGHEPLVDIWAPDGEHAEPHVALGREADLMLVTPATASVLGRLAHGISDDCVTLTGLAMRGPLLVAPAMDAGMWANAATQANVRTLQERGVTFLGPLEGRLASGEIGAGRLMEPVTIVDHIKAAAGRLDGALAGARIAVTAGGTREPVDPVRFVGNRSSGKMGYAVAEAARDRGADVVLITSAELAAPAGVRVAPVETAQEMLEAVEEHAATSDALIMAAAVADYRPVEAAKEKQKRGGRETWGIDLVRNPDIIATVQGERLIKVAFAAETQDLVDNAQKKLVEKNAHLIVANDVSATDAGFAVDTNRITILDRDGNQDELPLMSKYDCGVRILDRVQELLAARG